MKKLGEGGWDAGKVLTGTSACLTHWISKYPGTELVINS